MINSKTLRFEIALDVAEKIRKEYFPQEKNSEFVNKNHAFSYGISLAGGCPGVLLLFSLLYKREESGSYWGDAVHHCVLRIKKIIENSGLSDLSLFNGVAGVCFALEIAGEKEGRYAPMLLSLQNFLLKKVRKSYVDPVCENVHNNCPSPARLYDTIQGICGIGRYVLKNLHLPEFKDLALDITKALVLLCLPLTINGKNVPGWYLPAEDPLNYRYVEADDKGNFNLGLAHGVTGILAYLCIAALHGIIVDRQIDTIQQIVNWVREKGDHRWPASVSWQEQTNNITSHKNPSRDAWCYGVPGIARTLFLAGKALHDESLQDFAMDSFQKIFERPRHLWQIPGPGLCHGIAGLLLITSEMNKEEKGRELSPQVEKLEQLLLSYYDSNLLFGFRDFKANDEENQFQDNACLLEGSTGIALTLLTLYERQSDWHLPFLIHG